MKQKIGIFYLALGLCVSSLLGQLPDTAYPPEISGWHSLIEAESMELVGDWKVVRGQEGYTPGAPNIWSAHRLRGGKSAAPAKASSALEIPADGEYAIWVRYESPYAFDVHFEIAISQEGSNVFKQRFGDRGDVKCFNGAWRVQGPWSYHNTDFVYQRSVAKLKRGEATISLEKNTAGKYTAARIIDLIFLTDDLELEPKRELNAWQERGQQVERYYHPGIIPHAKRPYYFRITKAGDAEPGRVNLVYRFGNGWRGPRRTLAFNTADGFTEYYEYLYTAHERQVDRKKAEFAQEEILPANYDSGWQRYDLNTFNTATVLARAEAAATLQIATKPDGSDAVSFEIRPGEELHALVLTDGSIVENELLNGRVAATPETLADELADELAAYTPPGKRPYEFGLLITPHVNFGKARWKFFEAAGGSGVYFQVPPEAFLPENAKRLGVNRSMAYRALQNMGLKFKYYEGHYDDLRAALEKVHQQLKDDGVEDIPQTFKMIEESGPPSLALMRDSEIISERFRSYLKEQKLNPIDLVARELLVQAVAAGKTSAEDLWPLVTLSAGQPQDAAENPILYYHSKQFGNILFADNCAKATELVEEIFPEGSRANSGAIFPQDGHGVRRNWYDEFTLFRRKGMTSFGSEMTWGLNGTPYYAGVQTESYEGTIARGVAKYHDATMGPTHLLACKRYGYPADYVELTTYALASHGYRAVHYYINGAFTGLEQYKAMKRAGYTLGAVEDRLVDARPVRGKVALGWSETTTIWDQAEPTHSGFNRPGNLMYGLERHYLYLLLRHLQLSVDLLSDADIEEGRLDDYSAFFLVGDHITAKAAERVSGWVGKGGVLVASAGGGLWDEYNRPLDTLKEVYGIKGARHYAAEQGRAYIPGEVYDGDAGDNRLEKVDQALRAKMELIHAVPLDNVKYGGTNLPVMGYRQGLTAEEGSTSASFDRGGSAVVTHSFGKGQSLIMGFLPGIAYHYQAYPLRPYGRGGEDLSVYMYPDYKPEVRAAFKEMVKSVWPGMDEEGASVSVSHPYVEANLLVKDGRYYIALVNFSGEELRDVELRINKRDTKAISAKAQFNSLEQRDSGDIIIAKLDKLGMFDFIDLVQ